MFLEEELYAYFKFLNSKLHAFFYYQYVKLKYLISKADKKKLSIYLLIFESKSIILLENREIISFM